MKKVVLFILLLGGLSACDVYVVEPRFDPRDRIIGSYDVDEFSETYHDHLQYSLYIRKSYHYSDEVILENFYASEINVRAVVDFDRIVIPFQIIDGYEIQGSGTIHGDEISFTYSVKDLYGCSCTDFLTATAWQY